MEIFIGIAGFIIMWFAWQLYRAKKFNAFKRYIIQELSKQVTQHLEQQLTEHRCELFPNNKCHIGASQYYWQQSPARTLQYALHHELVTEEQLKLNNQYRFCQHLFHIEHDKLNQYLHHDKIRLNDD